MVMRNRRNGGGSAGGWDDLPPRVRTRLARPLAAEPPPRPVGRLVLDAPAADAAPPLSRPGPGLAADLARLGAAFVAVGLGLVLYLLAAVAYLADGPLPVLGR